LTLVLFESRGSGDRFLVALPILEVRGGGCCDGADFRGFIQACESILLHERIGGVLIEALHEAFDEEIHGRYMSVSAVAQP
jgi:hypothetical protein